MRKWLMVLAACCWSAVGWAAVPKAVPVTGLLTTAGGGPVADGKYGLLLVLYDKAVGGSKLLLEGPVQVEVTGGRFRYDLGSAAALTDRKSTRLNSSHT